MNKPLLCTTILFTAVSLYSCNDVPENENKVVVTAPAVHNTPPDPEINDRYKGIWKLDEDTNKYNYLIVEKRNGHTFNLTYMNRSGDNRGIEHVPGSYIDIKGGRFVHIAHIPGSKTSYTLRLLSVDDGIFSITAAVINDSTLTGLEDSVAVRDRISDHMNDAAYYSDTVHFTKKFTLDEHFD